VTGGHDSDRASAAGGDGGRRSAAAGRDASGATKAVHLVVTGRVQGVFFRSSTREQGERTGVTGWVRNRSDGSVEAHIQGPPELVDALVDWCRRGPPTAHVETAVVGPVAVDPTLTGFGIRA
jgi:acylphosphatase